jgi:hypothetical protein
LNNRFRKAGLCARKWPDCIFLHLLIQSFCVPCDLSSKNFSKKTLLFEAEIYVPGYAHNAGFCTIYPRGSGGLQRPLAVRTTLQAWLDNLNFDLGCPNDYLIFLEISNTVHSITNETPAEMLMGRQLRIRLDLIKPDITRQVHDKWNMLSNEAKKICKSLRKDRP